MLRHAAHAQKPRGISRDDQRCPMRMVCRDLGRRQLADGAVNSKPRGTRPSWSGGPPVRPRGATIKFTNRRARSCDDSRYGSRGRVGRANPGDARALVPPRSSRLAARWLATLEQAEVLEHPPSPAHRLVKSARDRWRVLPKISQIWAANPFNSYL